MSAAIEKILREFDWERVRRTMLALDWKWSAASLRESEPATPTVELLRSYARQRLVHVAKLTGTGYISGGGLVVRRDEHGYLTLAFEVATAGAQT